MIKLRPYQSNAVNDIRESYKLGKRAPLLVMPTGAGKTIVFSYIAHNVVSRNKRVLILVHRVELLRQTSAAMIRFSVNHGLINPLFTPNLSAPVQIASIQTMLNRMHLMPEPDMIIIDEAHHATAESWSKILRYYKNARVLGVTATPIRSDGNGLGVEAGGWFDDLLIGPGVSELIKDGYLVNPVVYAPAHQLDLSGIKTVRGDYDPRQAEAKIDKPTITGDAVAHYTRICPGTPAIVFCISVKHAEHVAEQFRQAGYRAYSVDGKMDDAKRSAIIGGLANGEVQVLTSCAIVSEGTDIPAVGCAIMLRPTQSEGLYLQQGGRALRPCEGKKQAIILDHVGNVIRFGMLDEERQWSLDGTKGKRAKSNTEPEIRVTQCQQCYSVHPPSPFCPVCGSSSQTELKTPKQVDGELKQLTAENIANLRRNKNREVGQAKTLQDLEKIERERGYKPGWAKHVYFSRQKGAVKV